MYLPSSISVVLGVQKLFLVVKYFNKNILVLFNSICKLRNRESFVIISLEWGDGFHQPLCVPILFLTFSTPLWVFVSLDMLILCVWSVYASLDSMWLTRHISHPLLYVFACLSHCVRCWCILFHSYLLALFADWTGIPK